VTPAGVTSAPVAWVGPDAAGAADADAPVSPEAAVHAAAISVAAANATMIRDDLEPAMDAEGYPTTGRSAGPPAPIHAPIG